MIFACTSAWSHPPPLLRRLCEGGINLQRQSWHCPAGQTGIGHGGEWPDLRIVPTGHDPGREWPWADRRSGAVRVGDLGVGLFNARRRAVVASSDTGQHVASLYRHVLLRTIGCGLSHGVGPCFRPDVSGADWGGEYRAKDAAPAAAERWQIQNQEAASTHCSFVFDKARRAGDRTPSGTRLCREPVNSMLRGPTQAHCGAFD